MAISQDETLKGNEKIEEAILGLQEETSQEMLAHVLTVIRRRMNENGCGDESRRFSDGSKKSPD